MLVLASAGLAGCTSSGRAPYARVQPVGGDYFPDIPFANWSDAEPEYLLYPGDEIEVALPTATELTRQMRIGPDGRISLPQLGHVMAADRTLSQLEGDVSAAYASLLLRPAVEVTLRQAGPVRIWVDGEVRNPGVFEMTGDSGAYQAVIGAGGYLPSAKPQMVALIRRGPGGTRMMRTIDLTPRRAEAVAIRRGDILYVPRSTLGELAAFFTQFRSALPIGFSYAINGGYAST
ncbi:polysaccharide biosynthesis/export family protein [Brevundimonas vesicularis]|uniref:polysaccharide biosynthesis/export family protein n=1 Tax=Brevundimonas vesicularis TaxID=41276 RepID=UPI0038D3B6B4